MSRQKQHRVPRLDLTRFTDDTGRFHYLDKNRKNWKSDYRNPESVMFVRGYYDIQLPEPGEDPNWVEKKLQQSEERANRVLDGLLKQVRLWKSEIPENCSRRRLERFASLCEIKCPISLSEGDAEILKHYVFWRYMRTHTRDSGEAEVLEEMKQELIEDFGLGPESLEKLDLETRVRDSSSRTIGEGTTYFQRLVVSLMGLGVSTSVGNQVTPFIVGDIAALNCIPKGKHLWDPGSEFCMPVSNDTAISIVPGSGVRFNPVLDKSIVRTVNENTFMLSNEVACSNEKVMDSLIRAFKMGRLYLQRVRT